MKIIIVHRYFWPDNAPYAQMLFKIAQRLVSDGHNVNVLSSHPSHHWDNSISIPTKEVAKGVVINRLKLLPEFGRNIVFRTINTIVFALQVFFNLLFRRADIVMVASTPPVLIATIVRWASKIKGFKYLYHCQDIHPEALNSISILKKNLLYKILLSADSKNANQAVAVVVLSDDMKQTLANRGAVGANIHIINNFIFDNNLTEPNKSYLDKNYFNILFAGNLGRFQNLELIIRAANLLQHENRIRFIFLGNGIVKSKLEHLAGSALNKTIFFDGHVPVGIALNYMKDANLGIISIAKGVINVAYPSKTMMYLSMGLPLLVLVEESELTSYVKENNLGYSHFSDSPQDLAHLITDVYHRKNITDSQRQHITDIANRDFGEPKILQDWSNLYSDLIKNVQS